MKLGEMKEKAIVSYNFTILNIDTPFYNGPWDHDNNVNIIDRFGSHLYNSFVLVNHSQRVSLPLSFSQ